MLPLDAMEGCVQNKVQIELFVGSGWLVCSAQLGLSSDAECRFLGPLQFSRSMGSCLLMADRADLGRTTLHTVHIFSLFHQCPHLPVLGMESGAG